MNKNLNFFESMDNQVENFFNDCDDFINKLKEKEANKNLNTKNNTK